ncbi:MAG: hypothetical protein WCE30_28765 [Mycobacterium sp.]
MTATIDLPYRRKVVVGRPAKPKTGRTQINSFDVIAGSATVLRPFIVALGVIGAAMVWSPDAKADIVGDALGTVGIGNNGPVSNAIAQVGTSICPMLVQPGSQVASNLTQASGNGGIAPPVAGLVTQMAIQSQCPAFMTALANGNIPALMGGGIPSSPLGLPGIPGLGTPGLPGLGGTPALPGLPGVPAGAVPAVPGAAMPTPGLGLGAPAVPGIATGATAPAPGLGVAAPVPPVPASPNGIVPMQIA